MQARPSDFEQKRAAEAAGRRNISCAIAEGKQLAGWRKKKQADVGFDSTTGEFAGGQGSGLRFVKKRRWAATRWKNCASPNWNKRAQNPTAKFGPNKQVFRRGLPDQNPPGNGCEKSKVEEVCRRFLRGPWKPVSNNVAANQFAFRQKI